MDGNRLFAIRSPQRVVDSLQLPVFVVVKRNRQNAIRLEPAQSFLKALDRIDVIVQPNA